MFFEWYDNRLHQGLTDVYRHDISGRQKLAEIVQELQDSEAFWKLLVAYEDEVDSAKEDRDRSFAALLALLARVYAAGSLRGCRVIDL